MPRARASVSGLRTDHGENWGKPDGCKFWKHDDAKHMMTWQDATCKRMTWQRQRITGRHLAQRSRDVTTLHHYERISSRDLEWHRRENRKGRETVKLSCFLQQTSETKEPCEVEQIWEKNTTKVNEVENTPLEKRDKEYCEKTLRLKGKIYIETTPVKTR